MLATTVAVKICYVKYGGHYQLKNAYIQLKPQSHSGISPTLISWVHKQQNYPTLNPLIQGYSFGYREVGEIRGIPSPRALDPKPLRLVQVTPIGNPELCAVQTISVIVLFSPQLSPLSRLASFS